MPYNRLNIENFLGLSYEKPTKIIELAKSLLPGIISAKMAREQGLVFYRLARARIQKCEYEPAFFALREARKIREELSDFAGVLECQLAFGHIYSLTERPEAAFELFLSIRERAQNLGLIEIEVVVNSYLARICIEQGQYKEARTFLEEALKLNSNNKIHLARLWHEMGHVELKEGNLDKARVWLEKVNEFPYYEYRITQAELDIRRGDFKAGEMLLRETLKTCVENEIRYGEILAYYQLGIFYSKVEDADKTLDSWENCYKLCESTGVRYFRILSGEGLVNLYRARKDNLKALNYLLDIRKEERRYLAEGLHHLISTYDQENRIGQLKKQMGTWRRRTDELERIRSNKDKSILDLETIRKIGQEITSSLDPDKIVKLVHRRLNQLMTVDELIIAFCLNENEMELRYIIRDEVYAEPSHAFIDAEDSLISWVILNNKDLIINSREESYNYIRNKTVTEKTNESCLVVRLKIERRIIGVLSIQGKQAYCYVQRHLKILEALAGFIAIALSHSNSHQSLVLANKKISYMATHDPLTNLPNRLQTMDRLNLEIRRCQRHDKTLAVLFVDLDGFKEINDNHGHMVGDKILKEMGKRLKKDIRSIDAVGRLAGDEFFLIITDDCTPKNGFQLAEKLRLNLATPIKIGSEKSLSITASMGLAFYPKDGENPESLVNAADSAMYNAKSSGKNRTFIYSRHRDFLS